MCKEFHALQFYDIDIWKLLLKDIETKKRINNIYFFSSFYESLNEMNTDPNNPFFKKCDKALAILKDKHYTKDR